MKLKKLISGVSALALALTTLGVSAYADGEVAKIGNTEYKTLADAVAAANGDTTITMIANETIEGNAGVTIPADKEITLDLNGHTIKNSVNQDAGSQVITNKGTLIIEDSTDTNKDGTGTGLITNAVQDGTNCGEWWSTPQYNYVTNVITNTGTLTINSGKLLQTASGSICYAIDNQSGSGNAILNMYGGYAKSVKAAVRMFCNSTTQNNELNMKAGKIEADNTGLWVQLPGSGASDAVLGTLNISGGTMKGGSYAFYDYSYGNAYDNVNYNLKGGTFEGSYIFSYGANFDISGGTYLGEVAIKQLNKASNVSVSGGKFSGDVYTYSTYASKGFITGGFFAYAPSASFVADNYMVVDNTDDDTKATYPYTIGNYDETKIVANTKDSNEATTNYASVGAALADAVADETENTVVTVKTVAEVKDAAKYAGANVILENLKTNKIISTDIFLKKDNTVANKYQIVEKPTTSIPTDAGTYIQQRADDYDIYEVKSQVTTKSVAAENPTTEGEKVNAAEFTISDGVHESSTLYVTNLPQTEGVNTILGIVIQNITDGINLTVTQVK